ncbi:hypothetical protein RND81_03G161600 [Saponaria officinalis]|uniref:Uncharacterized protein n=1 Tax=Saponaria officinalis TaxID=3572 RepID=A0AAW1M8I6_SAPOF
MIDTSRFSFGFLWYGFNFAVDRPCLWDSLRSYDVEEGAWFIGWSVGTSIVLLIWMKDWGVNAVNWAEVAPFRQLMVDCLIYDMKATSSFFTWNNKQGCDSRVYSRIDRVLINDEWLDVFPDSIANFLPEGMFDHCPCLIDTQVKWERKRPPFKYFNMWAVAEDFEDVVKRVWSQQRIGSPMYNVVTKLKMFKPGLRALDREVFSDVENLTLATELAMRSFQEQLIQQPLDEELCRRERACASDLEALKDARQSFLAQKAKEDWFQKGDDNTGFFHATIRRKRARNNVYQVKHMNGVLCSSPVTIQHAFENYYKMLLGESKPVAPIISAVIQNRKCITDDHIQILNGLITNEEIKNALFDLHSSKAPGPDGFGSQFFKDTGTLLERMCTWR